MAIVLRDGPPELDVGSDPVPCKNIDPEVSTCFVDIQAASTHSNNMAFKLPCLTASRGATGGYYVSNRRRMTTIEELGRLRGGRPRTSPPS